MKVLAKIYRCIVVYLNGGINRLSSFFYKRLMIACGRNVRFSARTSDFTYTNISIGNDVYIGPKALFVATESKIFIGNKVMFGPGVTIIGGDHNISTVGRFMYDVKEKQPEDDQDVHIEDDVWVAANVTILKGVTIGRGAVVAAGALVNNDVPPYAIVAGMPAKVLRYRLDLEKTIEHEELLYGLSDRLSVEELKRNRHER